MNEKPLLSIYIVTYNHKPYLERAIRSVLEQKVDFKVIIFIYDDASTDGTSDIVRQYANLYPDRIVPIIREHNLGVVKNIYDMLCSIKTEFFILLEGDDYWCDSDKLQLQIDLLRANHSHTFCAHLTLYDNKVDNTKSIHPYEAKASFPLCFNITIENAVYLHTTSRLYRNIVDFTKEDMNFIIYDTNLFYKFLSLGNGILINKVMSVYNITGTGVHSSLSQEEKNQANAKLFYNLDKYFNYKYTHIFKPWYQFHELLTD